jgi:hypothetical protein
VIRAHGRMVPQTISEWEWRSSYRHNPAMVLAADERSKGSAHLA